uniref:Cytochrome b n=1 Tax=Geomydoecus aurei TaxID=161607 RepID=A0A8F4M8U0_9NEOP|nr:cytochrome b [Geomydoecus aurei]
MGLSSTKLATHIPTPSSISYMWNFGSLLGFSMGIQIISGLFLTFYYESSLSLSFDSVVSIYFDKNGGWIFRLVHSNGASMIFIFMYAHIARGLWYGSFVLRHVWMIGVSIYLMTMAVAFLGYVLPWGQMSYWGATVITNLVSTIPFFGPDLLIWLWGGFSVSKPTLIRFFSLHFILPFVILVAILAHLAVLHITGSLNPLGVEPQSDKVHFHPYFILKDLVGLAVVFFVFLGVCLNFPDIFMDCDNFTQANPLSTPPHIQPEWYFLFAYAILRCIPSKLGGVLGLVMSVLILYTYVSLKINNPFARHRPMLKFVLLVFFVNFLSLTWLGMMPVEDPFISVSKVSSMVYFSSILTHMKLVSD